MHLLHAMPAWVLSVRSGGFCPPDPPSKKWCMAPKVVCGCMAQTLKVMGGAYVLQIVENLKFCSQALPSQKNKK